MDNKEILDDIENECPTRLENISKSDISLSCPKTYISFCLYW